MDVFSLLRSVPVSAIRLAAVEEGVLGESRRTPPVSSSQSTPKSTPVRKRHTPSPHLLLSSEGREGFLGFKLCRKVVVEDFTLQGPSANRPTGRQVGFSPFVCATSSAAAAFPL